MNREHISKSNISIKASPKEVWQALVQPEIAKKYFYGAKVLTDWKEGNPIVFKGEFNGNKYLEKGTLLTVKPTQRLQYTHWSNLDGIPDLPENYRIWTFDLLKTSGMTQLSISEDNIPTEKLKERSDEFWTSVLKSIKEITEKDDTLS